MTFFFFFPSDHVLRKRVAEAGTYVELSYSPMLGIPLGNRRTAPAKRTEEPDVLESLGTWIAGIGPKAMAEKTEHTELRVRRAKWSAHGALCPRLCLLSFEAFSGTTRCQHVH